MPFEQIANVLINRDNVLYLLQESPDRVLMVFKGAQQISERLYFEKEEAVQVWERFGGVERRIPPPESWKSS